MSAPAAGAKTATYAFYLVQQPVWQGVIPYTGAFGIGINGHLVSIANPGVNAFGPGVIGLVTPNGGTINLQPGASTSPADVANLFYGSSSPFLPVNITGIVYTGVYGSIRVDVTYTYQ